MNLYIETENGISKNHPALENNLIQAFGAIPENWEKFVRVEPPTLDLYQVFASDEPVYSKIDGVWTDVWMLRDMTAEEKATKQQDVRDAFNNRAQSENWSAWILDDATCTMIPPIPRPEPIEGVLVFWCGADSNWREAPNRPEGNYKFDYLAWQWNAVVN